MQQRPRKQLGQHFLHDPAVIARIVATIAPRAEDRVIEVGGGRGALTRPLLERLDRLHVIEIDTALAALLGGLEGCIVHRADALKVDLAAFGALPASLRLVGNLPYNISTPLLFRFLAQRHWVQDMHFMLQKEVVQRMVAPPGSRDYGRLTIMLAAWTELEACFDIGPGAFTPPPRVWSTFVRIMPRRTPLFPIADEPRFAALVAAAFSMRRKMISTSLRAELDRAAIEAAGIDPRARPETLRPQDFARLAALPRAGSSARPQEP
jgi:16S rRNA (adenine1518-N6/adenine1519-N6)-dimethyltransferase